MNLRFVFLAILLICEVVAAVDVEAEPPPKIEEWRSECERGVASGCFNLVNLGLMYEFGQGVKRDESRAVDLYRKACDGGNALGCTELGRMYFMGQGVKQNYILALEFSQKACDDINIPGCFYLAVMYENGHGVKQNYVQARDLYRRGCAGTDTRGCIRLGEMYEQSISVKQDMSEALKYYGKACDLEDEVGCKNYARVNTIKNRPHPQRFSYESPFRTSSNNSFHW